MEFEYDPNKSASNKEKHGIDFEEAQRLWADKEAVMLDLPFPDEVRYMVLGVIDGKNWSAVVTDREGVTRIISVRRSRKQEVDLYERNKDDER